jgi:uncharacterized protein YggE
MIRVKIWAAVLSVTVLHAGPSARAQFFQSGGSATSAASDNIDGFTVAGKGAASAKPNRLEIDLEVTAASELSADAIVKYRDAKKRLQEAFAALKLSNVTVEERGLLVDQKGATFNPYYMDSAPSRKTRIEVQLTRKLVVTCTNLRSMDEEAILQLVAKLLDVAQDAGGKVGGGQQDFSSYYFYGYNRQSTSGLVRFILDDFASLQEQAYQNAVADARARAVRLAKLSGVELGRVAGVREVYVPGERAGSDDEMPKKRLESSKFQEIPVRVELQVRFETAAAPKAKGRDGQP